MLADKGMRLPEALKLIRKAVELEPMNGAFLDSLGWAYFKLGQYELAEETAPGRRTRPDRPTVHDHLGDLYKRRPHPASRCTMGAVYCGVREVVRSRCGTGDVAKVQHKLENARVKLAKQESVIGQPKPE